MDRANSDAAGEAVDNIWALSAYQQRSRQQRDRLLKAGERVFAKSGSWQAHVADIARRAGCSVGSFYRRFHHGRPRRGQYREILRRPGLPDRAAHRPLRAPGAQHRSDHAGIEGYYRALFELSLRGHDVWPPMRRLEMIEADYLLDLLAAHGVAVDAPRREVAQLAMRVMHSNVLATMLHGPGPFSADDPRLHDELGLMLVRYLGLESDPGTPPI